MSQGRSSALGISRSTPSLAASYCLRQYSLDRRRLLPERPSSTQKPISYEKIDLVGGNGKWRQRKAQLDWEQKEVEAEEQRRHQERLDEEKRRRRAQKEAARRQRMEEEKKQNLEHQEKKLREHKAREEEKRRQVVQEAIRKDREHQEWLARQPKPCDACSETGRCTKCSGKGTTFSVFLTSKVTADSNMDFGRSIQGCEDCGGCNVNMLGELKPGSGKCPVCMGHGKLWPKIEVIPDASPQGRRRTHVDRSALMALGELYSPKSPGSPKEAWEGRRTTIGAIGAISSVFKTGLPTPG